MINFYSALVGVATIFGVSLLVGYAGLHRLLGQRLSSYSFFVRLPLYTAFGITILIPIFLVVAFLKVSILTVFAVLLVSVVYLAWSLKATISKDKQFLPRFSLSGDRLLEAALPLILFITTTIYFLLIVDLMGWPSPGDIETGIGPLTTLIGQAGKVPMEPSPILILYPPGFPAATATLNTLMRLYPAEGVLLMGASVIILIPQLLYSLTYFVTGSKIFSTVAFFSSLLVHPSINTEKWVVGYFFNGPYPSLTGFLITLTFANIVVLLSLKDGAKDPKNVVRTLIAGLIISISLIPTYPSFALLTITYTLIVLSARRKLVWEQFVLFSRHLNLSLVSKIVIVVITLSAIAFLYNLVSSNSYTVNMLISYLKGTYFPGGPGVSYMVTKQSYFLSPSFFFDNVNGVMALIAYPIAINFALRNKRLDLPLLYLAVGTLVFVSLSETIFQFVFVILPARSVIIISLLAGPLILIAVDGMLKTRKSLSTKNFSFRIGSRDIRVNRQMIVTAAVGVMLIVAFAPFLYGYFGFAKTPWTADDFAALDWINKNVGDADLILNDGSHASMYLWSISIKNITHHLWTQYVYEKRFDELLEVWKNPSNTEYIVTMLRKYDVKYVFSTSELGYQLYGERHGYYIKPFTPAQYAAVFDQYNFLKPVFKSGPTRVYQVELNLLPS